MSLCRLLADGGKMWITKDFVTLEALAFSWSGSGSWVSFACGSSRVAFVSSPSEAASLEVTSPGWLLDAFVASWYVSGLLAMSDCAASSLSANERNDDGLF